MALVNGKQAMAHIGLPKNPKRFHSLVKAGVIPVFVDPISGTKRYSTESLDIWLAGFKPMEVAS